MCNPGPTLSVVWKGWGGGVFCMRVCNTSYKSITS